jgi:hypothetical protein
MKINNSKSPFLKIDPHSATAAFMRQGSSSRNSQTKGVFGMNTSITRPAPLNKTTVSTFSKSQSPERKPKDSHRHPFINIKPGPNVASSSFILNPSKSSQFNNPFYTNSLRQSVAAKKPIKQPRKQQKLTSA